RQRCAVASPAAPAGARPKPLLVAQETNFLAPVAGEKVDAICKPDPIATRAHDEGMRPRRVGQEAHPTEEIAVRDACCRDDHFAGRQLLGGEHPGLVLDADLAGVLDLPAGGRPELRLGLPPEATQGGGRPDRLAGPTRVPRARGVS